MERLVTQTAYQVQTLLNRGSVTTTYDDDSGGESKHDYAIDYFKYYVEVDP